MEKKVNEHYTTNVDGQELSTPLPPAGGVGGGAVIRLTGINKIYRTEEVETQALENVNIEVRKG